MCKFYTFAQEGATSVGKIKNWVADHFVLCMSACVFVCCIIGGWLLYTASRAENDYHSATGSVEHVEEGIDRAGKRLESAQTEVKDAQVHIQRADTTAKRLTERTKQNQRRLTECEQLTDRMQERAGNIQAIIRDIESTDQTTGTQTDSHT